jgi:hypothetical protein
MSAERPCMPNDSPGRFWNVVTAFEVVRARKCSR